jgi:hypothetical protein
VTDIKDKEEGVERVVAHGEDERTPVYLHFGVLVAVSVLVGVVVGLVFLAQALA